MLFSTTSKEVTKKEQKHGELVRKAGPECMVLMEHDGTLPLKAGTSIALYGAGARRTIKGGTGSGDVNSRHVVSIEEGLIGAGFTVTTKKWLDDYDATFDDAKEAYDEWVKKEVEATGVDIFNVMAEHPFRHPAGGEITAKELESTKADTAVYVISRSCGEGADRKDEEGDYKPTREELEDISALRGYYGKIVLLLNIGAVMDMKKIKEASGDGTILLIGQTGCAIGDSVADVMAGKAYPSGKLTDTWAVNYMDYPSSPGFSHNNGDSDDEYYEDGIFTGYRYFDSFDVKPEYGFGYGLSYTQFAVKMITASLSGTKASVRVKVTNKGKHPGREVVQAYLSKPWGRLVQPFRELCAYKKTAEIAPGMSDIMDIEVNLRDMASFDAENRAAVLEKGQYVIYIGNSLEDSKACVGITLDNDAIVKHCPTVFEQDRKIEEISPSGQKKRANPEKKFKLQALSIQPEELPEKTEAKLFESSYRQKLKVSDILSGECTAEEFVSQLTTEEMASLCVGILRGSGTEVVGQAAKLVPGAAGETSSVCAADRGLRPLILADGPAGLRLEQSYEHEGTTYYQYCTAIPVGWSLAQSWNTDLLTQMGDLIGTEMNIFHIDLWLAPALNIHRNPLCGRNFEYYSEDPVISGTMAAAITRGVHKHPGLSTTIKHFACNNLEDNRFFNNSHVSERAIRDIYIKGFEIAVKTSQPRTLMSSYNLLNGTHTANLRELLTGVLRDEWGYEGLVMTDWFTSKEMPKENARYPQNYGISSSVGCIYAGNDIQMPGCQENYDDIVDAIKNDKEIDGYKITTADLQLCTKRVVEAVVYAVRAD